MRLILGTRGSALALWQANYVAVALRAQVPELEVITQVFKTQGDLILERPLAELGGKGLFTKELELALVEGQIDLAVHSLKDVPTKMPPGLILGAIPERADPRDALVRRADFEGAPQRVGTSSLRRACLVRRQWPGAELIPLRGNVPTRLGRLGMAEGPDAVVLALAGLMRLGLIDRPDLLVEPQPVERFVPAVGQGALAVQCREHDDSTRAYLKALACEETTACVTAERAFLATLEGDCRVPVGAHATREADGSLRLIGMVGSSNAEALVMEQRGHAPEPLGEALASALLEAGGRALLGRPGL